MRTESINSCGLGIYRFFRNLCVERTPSSNELTSNTDLLARKLLVCLLRGNDSQGGELNAYRVCLTQTGGVGRVTLFLNSLLVVWFSDWSSRPKTFPLKLGSGDGDKASGTRALIISSKPWHIDVQILV